MWRPARSTYNTEHTRIEPGVPPHTYSSEVGTLLTFDADDSSLLGCGASTDAPDFGLFLLTVDDVLRNDKQDAGCSVGLRRILLFAGTILSTPDSD